MTEHVSKTCDEHPHCPFCGGVLVEDGDQLVCVRCDTVADARLIVATVIR